VVAEFALEENSLSQEILKFCRGLRHEGLQATTSEVNDAMRAASAIDISDRDDFYWSLRTVLAARQEDLAPFDLYFALFWDSTARLERLIQKHQEDARDGSAPMQRGEERERAGLQPARPAAGKEADDAETAPLYSPRAALMAKDFSNFQADDMAEFVKLLILLTRRLSMRLSRRTKPSKRGTTIDLRRTIRKNLKFGDSIVELARKQRKRRRSRLVLLCDVSRSMDIYSRFLLHFIYALQRGIARVESFVFSTSLTRVTPYFRQRDVRAALDEAASVVPDWSGGTRIGYSLRTFNEDYAHRVSDKRTVVLFLSDGLDTGEVELLEEQITLIKERVGKIVWLNPLAGHPDYRPAAQGMQAALRHVNVFAPAHNLESLKQVVKYLL
jgi:uncharacterized protein with von Willebrand factor type A (vWA) domain